ncbi:MAG: response regulator, partial [Evtepia sp.]
MHIGVCVQNEESRNLLMRLLERYQELRACPLVIRSFSGDIDLVCNLVAGTYDAIFFTESAYGLTEEIQEKDRRVRLVRLTKADNVTQEMDDVWYCLPDPPGSAFLFPLLDRLRMDAGQEEEHGLLVKSRGSILHLPFSHIEYVEVQGHTVLFHLFNQKVEKVSGTFSDFEPRLLSWPDFVKVHRAYIVNLRYMERLEPTDIVTQNGTFIPVSKRLYSDLRKDYLCRLSDPGSMPTANPIPPPAPSTNKAYRILIVDDEADELVYWSKVLQQRGCEITSVNSGAEAIQLVCESYDCILLDVMLGCESGFEVCRSLQERTNTPIVFLSTRTDNESQLEGFEVGGIDYIAKDTRDELFWAKIDARIRLSHSEKKMIRFGPLSIDPGNRRAELENLTLTLTTTEFDLLWLLAQRIGTVCR